MPGHQLERGVHEQHSERVDAPRGADVGGEGHQPADGAGVVALAADGQLWRKGPGPWSRRHLRLDQEGRPVGPRGRPLATPDQPVAPAQDEVV